MNEDNSQAVAPFAGAAADAVAGAALGLVLGGPAAAVVGALAPFAQKLVRLSAGELSARQDRAAAAWMAASQATNTEPEELLRLAQSDADRQHLGYSVGEYAATSRYPERIVALGRLLGSGLLADDEAVLDDEQQMADAIGHVERPHLTLLMRLMIVEPRGDDVSWIAETLNWQELQDRVPLLKRSLPRLLATVEREGLVRTEIMTSGYPPGEGKRPDEEYGGVYWRLTPFGLEALARLRQAGRGLD